MSCLVIPGGFALFLLDPNTHCHFLFSLIDERESIASLHFFESCLFVLGHCVEIALQGSAWNMVLMPELFSVINTGGPKVPPSCI